MKTLYTLLTIGIYSDKFIKVFQYFTLNNFFLNNKILFLSQSLAIF